MINEEYKAMLGGKSVIRELSEYATSAVPKSATRTCSITPWQSLGAGSEILHRRHGRPLRKRRSGGHPRYSPRLGIPSVKDAIAENSTNVSAWHTPATTSSRPRAAGALSHAMRAVTKPGDEIITFAPTSPNTSRTSRRRRQADHRAGRHRELPNQLRRIRGCT